MKKNSLTKPVFASEYIWKSFVIFAVLCSLHIFVYIVSVSEDAGIQNAVKQISSYVSLVMVGSSSYEYLDRPFHIPYMQIALGLLISIPFSIVACGSISRYTMRLYGFDDKSVFDIRLISVIGVVGAIFLFFVPPSPFGGKLYSGHFGLISAFRYSIAVFGFGYFLRLIFADCEKKGSDVAK